MGELFADLARKLDEFKRNYRAFYTHREIPSDDEGMLSAFESLQIRKVSQRSRREQRRGNRGGSDDSDDDGDGVGGGGGGGGASSGAGRSVGTDGDRDGDSDSEDESDDGRGGGGGGGRSTLDQRQLEERAKLAAQNRTADGKRKKKKENFEKAKGGKEKKKEGGGKEGRKGEKAKKGKGPAKNGGHTTAADATNAVAVLRIEASAFKGLRTADKNGPEKVAKERHERRERRRGDSWETGASSSGSSSDEEAAPLSWNISPVLYPDAHVGADGLRQFTESLASFDVTSLTKRIKVADLQPRGESTRGLETLRSTVRTWRARFPSPLPLPRPPSLPYSDRASVSLSRTLRCR